MFAKNGGSILNKEAKQISGWSTSNKQIKNGAAEYLMTIRASMHSLFIIIKKLIPGTPLY
jgi:hypothetical protein